MDSQIYKTPAAPVIEEGKSPSYPQAGSGKRFLNYFIDTVAVYALLLGFAVIFGLILGLTEQSDSHFLEDGTGWGDFFTLLAYGLILLYQLTNLSGGMECFLSF